MKAVEGLADSLGIEVINVGVAQQRALQRLGVRRMQGWLYGKAVDQHSICGLLAAPVPMSRTA